MPGLRTPGISFGKRKKQTMEHLLQKVFYLIPRKHDGIRHSYSLAPDRKYMISDLLEKFMTEEKPFLRIGYSIRDLAEALDIPSYQLSAFLNREVGLNFNDFFNHYRVWHCEELIQKGLVFHLDLTGLARECGFTNRNTLTNAFKKLTGFTPSRYQRGWEKLLYSESYE
jgi:AraC-like DNA-binding protein